MSPRAGRPRTAFVLAGGGSFGAIQVGMLKALAAAEVAADMVVGSSVGAINAAYYAGRPTAEGIAELERLWRSIRRDDVFPIGWRGLAGFLWRRDHLVDNARLMRLVKSNLPFERLEAAALPVHIVATDILSGTAVVLSEGPAAEAIVASCAIPAAFPAVALGGHHLADGALTSNTPVRIAVAAGAQRLVVLPTGFACALAGPPQGAIASALHALTLLIARQLVGELEALDVGIDYTIVPPLCPLDGSPYDFTRTGALIERAETSTAAWIESGGLQRREIPGGLEAHSHAA
jgi:NTE family protein